MSARRVHDYRPSFDHRSRRFAVGRYVTAVERRDVYWAPGPVLDQGQEGACVGHGWANEATAEPFPVDFAKATLAAGWPHDPQAFAFYLYDWCRHNDEYPGDDTEGTSVLTGAKAMNMLGLVTEYRWAFGIQQVIDALITHGPVILGIPWYDGMYDAPHGDLAVTGTVVGGHCILAIGYQRAHRFATGEQAEAIALVNSWGPDWGVNGVAWIRVADLGSLLADNQGEACVPITRTLGVLASAAVDAETERARIVNGYQG